MDFSLALLLLVKAHIQSIVQVSAGELLGRTHEELVLLLIQLRRASAAVCKAMESCHMEIETQVCLHNNLLLTKLQTKRERKKTLC